MRKHEESKATSNRGVYNRLHKSLHAYCSFCGWNRGCNRRKKRRGRDARSWKNDKRSRQWMNK